MAKELLYQMKSISDAISPSLGLQLELCGTTYPNRNYAIYRPESRISCIEYVISGTGEVQIDGETAFHPKAGDTYFLPAGPSYRYFSNRKDPWEKIWINFSGEYATHLTKSHGLLGIYHFPSLDTSDLLSKIQYYAAHAENSASPEECVSLLERLFFRMAQFTVPIEKKPLTPIQKMLRYIEQHEADVIRLEQLAAVCEKSPSQTERLFSSAMGMPIYRYVLSRKIELAKKLLRETGMPIHDIASYLSFEDAFYFSGLFRKKVGCSPTQYRKMEESALK